MNLLQHMFYAKYNASVAFINYLDNYTCENIIFTVVTFMTLKMTLKPESDNDTHQIFLSSHEWMIPHEFLPLTNTACKNHFYGSFPIFAGPSSYVDPNVSIIY